jgi:hypothetical protein
MIFLIAVQNFRCILVKKKMASFADCPNGWSSKS